MKYIKVLWKHDFEDEPETLFSELGPDRYETRKVEVFKDGSVGYASETLEYRSMLGTCPVPSLKEIAADEYGEFEPTEISADDFAKIWEQAQQASSNKSLIARLREFFRK